MLRKVSALHAAGSQGHAVIIEHNTVMNSTWYVSFMKMTAFFVAE